ncbi:hypothetical protein [Rhodococcus sp. NPDC049939]|uniref:hypothetical protein n=1 Tax=Rhodococcus sp. NPDC049939 TaxID=3155511 RepID=UPI0033CE9731
MKKKRKKWPFFAGGAAILLILVVVLLVVVGGLFSGPAHLDRDTYETLSEREYEKIVRNPEAHEGRKILVYGTVFQFDTRTGPEVFMADTGAQKVASIFYDQYTAVTGDAEVFVEVVEDDLVAIYASVAGTQVYETVSGDDREVPLLRASIVDVIG